MTEKYEGFVKLNGTLVTSKISSRVSVDHLYMVFKLGDKWYDHDYWLSIRPFTLSMLDGGTRDWAFSGTDIGRLSVGSTHPEASKDYWQVISAKIRIEHFSDLIRIAVTCHTATGKTIDNWPQKVRREGLKAQILDLAFNVPRTGVKDFMQTKATWVNNYLERLGQIREDLEKYQQA
jgi:hypothetical protein